MSVATRHNLGGFQFNEDWTTGYLFMNRDRVLSLNLNPWSSILMVLEPYSLLSAT